MAVNPEKILRVLNEALALDREAVTDLVRMSVPCSTNLGGHKRVCIRVNKQTMAANLDILGLLEGMVQHGTFQLETDEEGFGTRFIWTR